MSVRWAVEAAFRAPWWALLVPAGVQGGPPLPGEGQWETGWTSAHRAPGQGATEASKGLVGEMLCNGDEGWWAVLWSGGSGATCIVCEGHVKALYPMGPTGVV